MGRIAIDIVLLPPEEAESKAIFVNGELIKKNPDNLILNKNGGTPHISLCMGVIDERDLSKVENSLKDILRDFGSFFLRVEGAKSKINPLGKISNSFEIAKDNNLQRLHEEIAKKISPFFHKKASEENFFLPLKMKELTIKWTEEYLETSAFEKFKPHISLGFGELQEKILPFNFVSSNIAVFQLGDYCACRKKLIELSLI